MTYYFTALTSLPQGDSFSADEEKTAEILATLKKLRAFHKYDLTAVQNEM